MGLLPKRLYFEAADVQPRSLGSKLFRRCRLVRLRFTGEWRAGGVGATLSGNGCKIQNLSQWWPPPYVVAGRKNDLLPQASDPAIAPVDGCICSSRRAAHVRFSNSGTREALSARPADRQCLRCFTE